VTTPDDETPRSAAPKNEQSTRSRRGLLAISAAAAAGAGVAAAATAWPKQRPVEITVSARSVQPDLSTAAPAQANTDALNSAIAQSATAGADVVLPGGEYGFLGVTLPDGGGVAVRGAGRGVTVLRNEGAAPSVTAHGRPGGTSWMSDWTVSGMTLTSADRRRGLIGLSVTLAHRFTISEVTVVGHDVGVRHESSWDGGYEDVSVTTSTTGWLFPRTAYAPTAPLGMRNCSAVECDSGAIIENAVEALEWIGGDFSVCGRGFVLSGNDTRSISLHGLNFERIRNEDVVIGDANTGPAAIGFHGCRFLRVDKGPVSVRFLRGDGIVFSGSRWTNYGTAVDQGRDSGNLIVNSSSGFEVDRFIATGDRVQPQGVLNASTGSASLFLSLDAASVLPAVVGTEGVATKVLSGDGKRSVADDDFAIPPAIGSTAVVRDTADGSVRHAIRGVTGWFVSAPYSPPAP
jgi:hypothetical protein